MTIPDRLRRPHTTGLPRRTFFSAIGVTATLAASGALSRGVHAATTYRGLTETDREHLTNFPANQRPLSLGLYPGFEDSILLAWHQVAQRVETLGTLEYLGYFALLQDAESDQRLDATRTQLTACWNAGYTPVLSLGIGSEHMQTHPFAPENSVLIYHWIERFAAVFASLPKEMTVYVRFLFEFNLRAGYVAYRLNEFIEPTVHRIQFQNYFAAISHALELHKEQLGEQMCTVKLAFCPSADGEEFVQYYPPKETTTIHAVGFDLYDQLAKMFLNPYDILYGPFHAHSLLIGSIQQLQECLRGQDPTIEQWVFEYGSRTHDVEFLDYMIVLLQCSGFYGLMLYDKNNANLAKVQGRSEEANWLLTPAELQRLAQRP